MASAPVPGDSTPHVEPYRELTLVAGAAGLVAVLWDGQSLAEAGFADVVTDAAHPVVAAARDQLEEYFAGSRTEFSVPVAPAGTPFQQAAWDALTRIP